MVWLWGRRERVESRMTSRCLNNSGDKNVIHGGRKGWRKNQFGGGRPKIQLEHVNIEQSLRCPRSDAKETYV